LRFVFFIRHPDMRAADAGYFLDSYSYTLQFMRKVELSGNRELNYPELSQLLNAALFNMQQARVTEIYGKLLADMEAILYLLKLVKKYVDANLFTPVKVVRKLNQTYSTALLFGQYVTGGFDSL